MNNKAEPTRRGFWAAWFSLFLSFRVCLHDRYEAHNGDAEAPEEVEWLATASEGTGAVTVSDHKLFGVALGTPFRLCGDGDRLRFEPIR